MKGLLQLRYTPVARSQPHGNAQVHSQASLDAPQPDTPSRWEGLKGAEQVNHCPPDGIAGMHIDQQPDVLQGHTHGPAECAPSLMSAGSNGQRRRWHEELTELYTRCAQVHGLCRPAPQLQATTV